MNKKQQPKTFFFAMNKYCKKTKKFEISFAKNYIIKSQF